MAPRTANRSTRAASRRPRQSASPGAASGAEPEARRGTETYGQAPRATSAAASGARPDEGRPRRPGAEHGSPTSSVRWRPARKPRELSLLHRRRPAWPAGGTGAAALGDWWEGGSAGETGCFPRAMELSGALSNPAAREKSLPIRLDELHQTLLERAATSPRHPQRALAKPSPVLETVTLVLELAGRPMLVHDIHTAAQCLSGQPLLRTSVKGILSAYTLGGDRRFRRLRRGIYELAQDA